MATVSWIPEFLRSSGVEFEERHHPEVFTAAQVAEKEKLSPREVAKVVVVLINAKPVGLVLPASHKVDLRALEEIAGTTKVRLAFESEIRELFPDCEVGAIPPLKHWKDIDFWMDSTMSTNSGDILIQAGTHTDAIRLRYDDWFRLVRPRVQQFAISKHPMVGDRDEERPASEGGQWAKIG